MGAIVANWHSLNVYFTYVSLNLPKIFSKTIIFVFFISIFYVINKYNNSNELIVFWNNGIQKISFINFILQFQIMHFSKTKKNKFYQLIKTGCWMLSTSIIFTQSIVTDITRDSDGNISMIEYFSTPILSFNLLS